MARPAVVLVGADKGGVGKTTVARTLLDYFAAHQTPTRAFDTESPRGTLKRFHPKVTEVVDVTSIPDQMKIFDTLGNAEARVTVIDVRAGLLSPTKRAVSAISSSDVIEGPRIWNTAKVIWPFLADSKKPISLSACSVGDNSTARTSITVTLASALPSVSKIFIWSGIEVTSTTSVTSGWKRLSVPRGASVSKARVGV